MYIYGLFDPRNGQLRYVGKSNDPNKRFRNHMNKLKEASHKISWIKSLKSVGIKPELEILDIVPSDEWEFWEKWHISYFKSIGCNLTNMTPGGENSSPSVEIIEKMRRSHIGYAMPMEQRLKISKALMGVKKSFEARQNMGKAQKGKTRPEELAEKLRAYRIGKRLSPEHSRKLHDSRRGVKLTLDQKINIGIKNRKFNNEQYLEISNMLSSGRATKEISKLMNCSHKTILRFKNKELLSLGLKSETIRGAQ